MKKIILITLGFISSLFAVQIAYVYALDNYLSFQIQDAGILYFKIFKILQGIIIQIRIEFALENSDLARS